MAIWMVALGVSTTGVEPWKRHTIDDSSRGADGVRVADVSGDGLLDIATGWEEGGVVRVYLNPGHAKAKQKWSAVTVGRVRSVEDAVFVDLDGDGAIDVVSSCEGNTRTMYVHWAPRDPAKYLDEQAWQTEPIPATAGKQQWMYCLPMQVDGKQGVDLVVGSKNKDGAVGWLESPDNPRELEKWTYHKIVDAGWIMSLESLREGVVAVSDRKGSSRGVFVLERSTTRGAVSWKRGNLGGNDREVMFIAVMGSLPLGDDMVSTDTILSATRNGKILMTGRFEATSSKDTAHRVYRAELTNPYKLPHGKAVARGDIDLDSKPDVVHTANTGGDRSKPGVCWIRAGAGNAASDISGSQGVKFDRIELIDLDGDGDLDVVTCEERDNLGVIWYENPTR